MLMFALPGYRKIERALDRYAAYVPPRTLIQILEDFDSALHEATAEPANMAYSAAVHEKETQLVSQLGAARGAASENLATDAGPPLKRPRVLALCKDFVQGKCSRANCRFAHDEARAKQSHEAAKKKP